jgi:hypothetical protein
LKVDIAKAFDSVAWPFLIDILRHIGFSRRWCNWISALLSTASTKVVVNGRPGRQIAHARGLRQGDPISPMLFVLVMEVLNSLIREADRRSALLPLPGKVVTHIEPRSITRHKYHSGKIKEHTGTQKFGPCTSNHRGQSYFSQISNDSA